MRGKSLATLCVVVCLFVWFGHNLRRPMAQRGAVIQVEIGEKGAYHALQSALLRARPGDVVQLPKGHFSFTRTVVLGGRGVTLRGRGKDNTVLSFKQQHDGAQGILVDADDVRIAHLSVEDPPGDGIRAHRVKRLSVQHVRVRWHGARSPTNGAYGIYPVLSKHIVIEHCDVQGASDAGIYVGQSQHIAIRHNNTSHNVAGIELENSAHADVSHNRTTHNTIGMMVFRLPCLCLEGSANIHIHHNHILHNNHPNFARGDSSLSGIPDGSGLLLGASQQVKVTHNTITGNRTFAILLASFRYTTQKPQPFSHFDPYVRQAQIHNNTLTNNGCCRGPTCAGVGHPYLQPIATHLQGVPMPTCPGGGRRLLPEIMYNLLAHPPQTQPPTPGGPHHICVYANKYANVPDPLSCAAFAQSSVDVHKPSAVIRCQAKAHLCQRTTKGGTK